MNNNNRKVEPFTLWRHFKGGKVIVLFIAKHSETGEDLVIYRCINKKDRKVMNFTLVLLPCFYLKLIMKNIQRLPRNIV